MGKRRTAGRSFFSNLPLDLRSNIRSQTLLPLVAGANIQDLDTRRDEFDKEIGGKELLPTQPASIAPSDSDSSEEEDENAEECRNTLSQATAKGTRRSETEQERPKAVVAESSMDALRRRAEEMAREKEQRERVTREPQAASSATGISVVPSNKRGHDAILESKNGIGNDTSATTDNGRSFPASFNPSFAKKQKRTGKQKGRGRGNGGSRTNGIVEPVEVENTNRYKGHRWDCTGLVKRYTQPTEMPSELVKYWYQRSFLLPQYDTLPLLLDDTGWFSITPQPIAAHIAERCTSDVIIDAFCGVGGNTIEFAKTCERVIAIDNDPIRLRLARHNALQMGVADRIEFILGDFVSYAKSLLDRGIGEEIDVVFLSPPWGGTDYLSFADPSAPTSSSYPLSAILPIHGKELFELCTSLTPNIAYYLPRNVNIDELSALARPLSAADAGGERAREWVEIEEEWVGDKLKAVTAYYGALVTEE